MTRFCHETFSNLSRPKEHPHAMYLVVCELVYLPKPLMLRYG
jgi:hypothetical protein